MLAGGHRQPGMLLGAAGNWNGAAEAFLQEVELDADDADSHLQLAKA